MLTKLNNSIILIISNNLKDSELLEISASNMILNQDIKKLLEERKMKFLNKLFNYFTFDIDKKPRFTIYKQYNNYYEKYRNLLMDYIPELFDFIKLNNITSLDFSCNTGGLLFCKLDYSKEQISRFMDQLYQLIESNLSHTLTYCNMGGFEYHIDKDKLLESIKMHPSIEVISIRSNGSRTNFNNPPHNLYKRNGTIEWSHF